jgi:hypothetical protein
MKKLAALIAFVGVVALAACGSTGGGDDGGDGGGCGGGGTDNTQMMIDNIKEASYWVTVHENPAAGEYWETGFEMSGMTNTTRWQVSKVDGSTAIIEQQETSKASWGGYNYVIAYEVDLSKTMDDGVNVNMAWIGKAGEAGKEIAVMAKPDATNGCAPEVESTTEPFEVEIAGGKWNGTLTTTTVSGTESKVWVADNGWFGKMVKMQSGDMVIELKAYGTDAKPLLTIG